MLGEPGYADLDGDAVAADELLVLATTSDDLLSQLLAEALGVVLLTGARLDLATLPGATIRLDAPPTGPPVPLVPGPGRL